MPKPEKNVAPLKGRAARRARKAARAGRPKRLAQIREAFIITKARDKRLIPYLALAFVVTLAVFEGAGLLLGSPILFSGFAVVSAVLVAFIVFGQRAQRSALGDIEGQPGAAAAIIDSMRGDWRLTPNVAATRSMDVVHRVVGKPGVVLIGEGSTERLQPLLADQRKRVQRVASGTPIEVLIVGVEPGQIPLRKLQKKMTRLPRTFKGATVDEIEGRMRALGTLPIPIPKGPMPKGARMPKGVKLPPR
ncbi:MAG TPA: DUF4191 domain-containing protein [Acidothermaceae bacterium]|jgi:hypothetical protein